MAAKAKKIPILDSTLRELPGTGGLHALAHEHRTIGSAVDDGGIRAVKVRCTIHVIGVSVPRMGSFGKCG